MSVKIKKVLIINPEDSRSKLSFDNNLPVTPCSPINIYPFNSIPLSVFCLLQPYHP